MTVGRDDGRTAAKDAAPRHDWVDAGRGLAIVLVVVVHACTWLATAGLDLSRWGDVNTVISGLRMPLFFTISGLLGGKWMAARWPALLSRKVLSLFWVYLLWQPVGTLAALVGAQITGASMSSTRMLASLAATPFRPRFELWFLWALSVFFVLSRLTARVPVKVQLVAAAAAAAVGFSAFVPDGNLGWSGVVRYYLFFLLGAHHRPAVLGFSGRVRRSWLMIFALIASWGVLSTAAYLTGAEQYIGVGLVTRLLGAAAGVAVAGILARWRLLRYLGSRTLPIYLAHTPLIVPIALLVHLQVHSGWVRVLGPVTPLLLTAVVVPLCLLLQRVLMATPARIWYAPPSWLVRLIGRIGPQRELTRGRGRRVAPALPAPRHASRPVARYARIGPSRGLPEAIDLRPFETSPYQLHRSRERRMGLAGQPRQGEWSPVQRAG